MLTVGIMTGVLGVLGLAAVLADTDRAPRVQGDPRCFLIETPLRQVQVHTLAEVGPILERDLAEAEPGQAAMVLVRACR